MEILVKRTLLRTLGTNGLYTLHAIFVSVLLNLIHILPLLLPIGRDDSVPILLRRFVAVKAEEVCISIA